MMGMPLLILVLYYGNFVKFVGANVVTTDVLVTISFMWVGLLVFGWCGFNKRKEELRINDRRTES